MSHRPRHIFILLLATLPQLIHGADTSPLAGTWRIDLARSSELSPWKGYDLEISTSADTLTFRRKLSWGRRAFSDTMTVEPGVADTVVPVDMWPDNRHLGAYIGAAKAKHVHAQWLDGHRILRLSTNLVLETQQGSREVNILSDYKVSANGAQLTLTELRSTRNRPIVYLFSRVAPPAP
ncbi:MAG: hypothetical protein ABIZ04_08190 [Opitutus sp.]